MYIYTLELRDITSFAYKLICLDFIVISCQFWYVMLFQIFNDYYSVIDSMPLNHYLHIGANYLNATHSCKEDSTQN